jgi:hypothetical protein
LTESDLLKIPQNYYKPPRIWGGLIYAMFFYVIEDKPPFNIISYSHAFIPKYTSQRFALVFPMGTIKIEKSLWAIPYGEGDAFPQVLFLSTDFISKQLISTKKKIHPKEFSFSWLPSKLLL